LSSEVTKSGRKRSGSTPHPPRKPSTPGGDDHYVRRSSRFAPVCVLG
jgi:hypothetical protein